MYKKYPRTLHLPWSKGIQSDDKVLDDTSMFEGREIVVLEKLDGENTTAYRDRFHARSIDSRHNFTRDWFARMHSVMKADIPKNIRLVFENVYAEHSIRYESLSSYAYLLSVWETRIDGDYCLAYDDTVVYSELLDVYMPKELYRGVFDEKILKEIAETMDTSKMEGYVIRVVDEFEYDSMSTSVSKYVRENHVQPNSEHWLKNAKPNGKLVGEIKPYYMS